MNPMIRSQLTRIEASLDELHQLLTETREHHTEQVQAREKLLKAYWSRGKEISVLNQTVADFEALQEENARLKEMKEAFREHLGRVLTYTKALTNEFRP